MTVWWIKKYARPEVPFQHIGPEVAFYDLIRRNYGVAFGGIFVAVTEWVRQQINCLWLSLLILLLFFLRFKDRT